jgi:predicted ArsR family transcriptional regulator
LSDTNLARALSSEERWKILELLMTRPLSDSQISKALGIRARVAREHLLELVNARLVDALHERLPSGKETVVYRVASSARGLGFPPRDYEYLSEALVAGLVTSLGEKSARLVLRDIGLKLGEEMGKSVLANTDSPALSVKEYRELVLEGSRASKRTYPRVLSQGRAELVYEQFNCPFQELAGKMPGLMCDVLDLAVHKGLDKSLRTKTTRVTCKGHGDIGCRFRVSLPN